MKITIPHGWVAIEKLDVPCDVTEYGNWMFGRVVKGPPVELTLIPSLSYNLYQGQVVAFNPADGMISRELFYIVPAELVSPLESHDCDVAEV